MSSIAIESKELITWIMQDFPPVWISKGSDKGLGAGDERMDFLIEQLTEYTHERIFATLSRSDSLFKQNKNVCAIAKLKSTEREEFMHFSSFPESVMMGNGFIYIKGQQSQFQFTEKPFLSDLLKNKKLRLGIVKSRKYGHEIDAILRIKQNQTNIYRRASGDTKGLLAMLLAGRIDYILGYDWELQYISKMFYPELQKQLFYLPLQETSIIKPYIVCAKTEWGNQVIQKIDKILLNWTNKLHYQNIGIQWLSNPDVQRKLFKEYYLNVETEKVK